ncbi:hypothetical protein [Streptomyces sp. NPDC094049]|uniref:hypothetical protein n=1 Tax=Streptomyces sp. NPDC094049 TaxID=3154987 RepID=UPI00331EA403
MKFLRLRPLITRSVDREAAHGMAIGLLTGERDSARAEAAVERHARLKAEARADQLAARLHEVTLANHSYDKGPRP